MSAESLLIIGLINWESGFKPAVGAGSVAAAFLMIHQSAIHFGTASLPRRHNQPSKLVEDPGQIPVEEPKPARRGDCQPIPALVSNAEATTEPTASWVVYRSMNGLCLSVAAAVDNGAVLSVRPATAPKTAPWVQVKVEACRPHSSGWQLVCRFTKPPTWGSVNGFYEQTMRRN
jgi:hypothetical protein